MDPFNNPYMAAALRNDAADAYEAAARARNNAAQLQVDLNYLNCAYEGARAQRNALLRLFGEAPPGTVDQVRSILGKVYDASARQEAERLGVDLAQFDVWLAQSPPMRMPAPAGPHDLSLPGPTADPAAQQRIKELEQQLAVANANAAGIATQRNALRRALGAADPRNAMLSKETQRQKYETGVRTQAERQGLPSEAVAALLRT